MHFKDILVMFIFSLSLPLPGVAQEAAILEYGARVNTIAFSPTETDLIAAAGIPNALEENTIKIWNLRNNSTVELRGHTDHVTSVTFSPSGKLLASASHDWTIRLWDVSKRQNTVTKHHVVNGVRWVVQAVAFSPDGLLLATAGEHVKVWNARTMEEMFTLPHSKHVWTVAFSRDNKYLAAGEGDGDGPGRVRVWDLQTQTLVVTLDADPKLVYSVVFSPDNQTLASGGWGGQIRLWSVPDWQLRGTFDRVGTIRSLDLTPDSKILAGGGFGILSLWSAESGRSIASLAEQVGTWEVMTVAFSDDGIRLASGGDDGNVRIWNIETHLQTAKQDEQRAMVRFIYFVPKDRVPRKDMAETIDTMIRDIQRFFAEQMESYGHGEKTFAFETDATGKALVRQVVGQFDDSYYHDHEEVWRKVEQEIGPPDDRHVDLIILDSSRDLNLRWCGMGGFVWSGGGRAVVGSLCFLHATPDVPFRIAHELGHTFGLDHDFRSDNYLMSYGYKQPLRLSKCATEWLDVHPMFNDNQTGFDEPMTIKMLTPIASPPHGISLHFEINDADGLHHSVLLGPSLDQAPGFPKLYACQALSDEREIIEFVIPELPAWTGRSVTLRVIDAHGRFWQETFSAEAVPTVVSADVNGDGRVSILDLVTVAANLGQTGQDPADVNGDGVVNILDLVLVAGAFRIMPAAPVLQPQAYAMLSAAEVESWLTQAQQLVLTDPDYLRGIAVLEKLAAALTPNETILLANYPNPFNPETWIPYELAAASDVRITIYDVYGTIVRRLDLGHQPAGYYREKDRAVYWDGRNESGEAVASGLYFYTLTTSGFSATRKMLIGK